MAALAHGTMSDEAVDDNNVLAVARDSKAAPPWFYHAMEEVLAPINDRLDKLDHLSAQIIRSARLASISYNFQAGSGTIKAFEIVLFPDGTDPTLVHLLPVLSNKAVVNNLSPQQSLDYYRGYYGPAGDMPDEMRRKELIMRAIGCGSRL